MAVQEPQTISDELAKTLVKEFKHPTRACAVREQGYAKIVDTLVENGATPYGAAAIVNRKWNTKFHDSTVRRHVNGECDCE